MTVGDFYEELNFLWPKTLSCDWDNDGLQVCANRNQEITGVVVALDCTDAVLQYAKAQNCNVVLNHHPLIFSPLKSLDDGDTVAKRAIYALQNGIAVMSFHTRLDRAKGGVNDTLACLMGLENVVDFADVGRMGEYEKALDFDAFVKLLKDKTKAPTAMTANAQKPVKKVAMVGGAGGDEMTDALVAGADTYVTGELHYHQINEAKAMGLNVVALGHFYSENPVCQVLKKEAEKRLNVPVFERNSCEYSLL